MQLFSREAGDEQIMQTEVAPKLFQPVKEAIKNQLWAAKSEGAVSGLHYEPVGVNELTGLMLDTQLANTQKKLKGHGI